jgi:hypothetical protein
VVVTRWLELPDASFAHSEIAKPRLGGIFDVSACCCEGAGDLSNWDPTLDRPRENARRIGLTGHLWLEPDSISGCQRSLDDQIGVR